MPPLEENVYFPFGKPAFSASNRWLHKAKHGRAEMGNRSYSVDCLGHHLLIAISQEVAIKAVISNSYRITTVTNEFDPELLTVRGWKALSPNTEAPKLVSGYKLCSSSLQIGIFPHGLKAPSGSCPLPLCTFRRRFGVRWEHRQFRSKKCFDWYSVKVSLECSTIYVESVEPL